MVQDYLKASNRMLYSILYWTGNQCRDLRGGVEENAVHPEIRRPHHLLIFYPLAIQDVYDFPSFD